MRTGRTRGPAGLARRDGRGEAWADTTPRSSYRLSRCAQLPDLTLAHAGAATCQDRVPGRHLSRSAPPAPWISRRADVEVRAASLQALPALDWLALAATTWLLQSAACLQCTVHGEVASTTGPESIARSLQGRWINGPLTWKKCSEDQSRNRRS